MANDRSSDTPDKDTPSTSVNGDGDGDKGTITQQTEGEETSTKRPLIASSVSSAIISSSSSSIRSLSSSTDASVGAGAGGVPSRKEETSNSSFSFKHFLRNSGENSLNGASSSSSCSSATTTTSSVSTTSTKPSSSSSSKPSGLRTSTSALASSSTQPNLGARPKVPHYSLHNGLDQQPQQQHQLPRMKRSPKFPSFDSHASLAEYSEEVSSSFVQRSHSNYEVETPASILSSSTSSTLSRRSPVNNNPARDNGSQQALCNSPINNNNNSNNSSGSVRNASDFQAALPDFVKDHMVLEQWYQTNPFRSNNSSSGSPLGINLSSSPPPAPVVESTENSATRRSYQNSYLFDLAMGSAAAGSSSSAGFRLATNSPTLPLDLPTYDPNSIPDRIPLDLPPPQHNRNSGGGLAGNPSNPSNSGDFPLDLTDRHQVNHNSRNENHHHGGDGSPPLPPPQQVQADMIQTLPDFLSDGPIHSSGRMADVAQDLPQLDSPEENAAVNVISRLRLENERLRHELDEARRLISDQGRQINDLERACRTGEIQRNGTVLERNKMNQKIAQLTGEIETLRVENASLREESGAVGGNSSDKDLAQHRPSQRMCQLVAMELKLAAGAAEANLRHLKMLAKRVEEGMEGEDGMEDYLSEGEEDYLGDGAGGGPEM